MYFATNVFVNQKTKESTKAIRLTHETARNLYDVIILEDGRVGYRHNSGPVLIEADAFKKSEVSREMIRLVEAMHSEIMLAFTKEPIEQYNYLKELTQKVDK
jgi:hypothetical protein